MPMSLDEFMGGGWGRTYNADIKIHLGRGRVKSYRPDNTGGTKYAILPDPASPGYADKVGRPVFRIYNTSASGGTNSYCHIKNELDTEIAVLHGGGPGSAHVGLCCIELDSNGDPFWVVDIYNRLGA